MRSYSVVANLFTLLTLAISIPENHLWPEGQAGFVVVEHHPFTTTRTHITESS